MATVSTALTKIMPLVVKPRAAAFDNPDWLFELKYDGFRALLEIDAAGARLVSRNRNRFKHLDPLAAALAKRLRVKDHPRRRDHLRRRDGAPDLHRDATRPAPR